MMKKILSKYNIRPSKKLGQNFLVDKSVLRKIIQTADLSKDDVVMEVGPGLGILTLELAKSAKKVIAVEKDKKMVEIVKGVLNDKNVENVEIIEDDIMKLDVGKLIIDWSLVIGHWKLVANIPYYLTSPLIRKFLETENPPQSMVLMVQKEVARRICAKPPKMTLLSVATQFYAEPKIISYVSKKAFWPQPKVDSAIIRITPRRCLPVIARRSEATTRQSRGYTMGLPRELRSLAMTTKLRDHFFKIAKAGFSQPRKQLINNLSKGLRLSREETQKILLKTGIAPSQRPSELSVDKWLELAWIIWGK